MITVPLSLQTQRSMKIQIEPFHFNLHNKWPWSYLTVRSKWNKDSGVPCGGKQGIRLWASWGQAPCLPWHPASRVIHPGTLLKGWTADWMKSSEPAAAGVSKGWQYLHRKMERERHVETEAEGLPPSSFWDLPLHSLLGRGHYSGNCEL